MLTLWCVCCRRGAREVCDGAAAVRSCPEWLLEPYDVRHAHGLAGRLTRVVCHSRYGRDWPRICETVGSQRTVAQVRGLLLEIMKPPQQLPDLVSRSPRVQLSGQMVKRPPRC